PFEAISRISPMRRQFTPVLVCGLALMSIAGCRGKEPEKPDPEKPNPPPDVVKKVDGPGLIWRISSDANTVFLVGSVHAGKKECYPLPDEVERSFAESKTLVMELDPNNVDQAAAAKIIATQGTYPPGQSLSRSLSKGTLELLQAYLAKKGMQLNQ